MADAAARSRIALPDDLRIWSLAGGRPDAAVAPAAAAGAVLAAGAVPDTARPDGQTAIPGDGAEPADAVALTLEAATDDGRRHAQGLHVTPRWLAEHLVALALDHDADAPGPAPGTAATAAVCDPACGGGAFLLAAARHLHRRGVGRRQVVRNHLWGADVDPVGLAAAEAALALWAGEPPPPGRLVVGDPLAEGAGLWPDAPIPGFAAVVGNPPFLSQLDRTTARSGSDRRRLRARFGDAVRAYTDTAWLFLLLGCELARPGGRVVLVEPESIVAARDARPVRAAVDGRAILRDLWLDDGRVFAAAVRVCAPVLERRADPASSSDDTDAGGGCGETDPGGACGEAVAVGQRGEAEPAGERWTRLWAHALGLPDLGVEPDSVPVPAVARRPTGGTGGTGGTGHVATARWTVGDRARVFAGFRDQYYGMVGLVREHAPDDAATHAAPLVTSGAIDWADCAWGRRPIRFAKARWRAPVVDLHRVADAPPVVRRWVERTRRPKILVATQTRVIEAAVDVDGGWVPSVPVVAVVPTAPGDLWRLAAALLAPAATAWLVRRAAGTGLDRGRLKVAGPDLVALPLPTDDQAWDAAAAALRGHVAAPTAASLDAYVQAIARAYGTPTGVTAWWRGEAGTIVRAVAADG